MAMSRKDYVALADAIAPNMMAYNADIRQGIEAVARDIADVLAADNPRFDRKRFLDACGYGQQKG